MNTMRKADSTFRLVLLAAKRAEQLLEGAKPRLADHGFAKPTTLALKEVEEGLVPWEILTPEEYERQREEELAAREREREREQVFAPPPTREPVTFTDLDEEEEEEEELEAVPGDEELAELEDLGEDELLPEEE